MDQQKVIVFAHHRDVIDAIANHYGKQAVKLYGGMSEKAKDEAVTRFMTDPSVRVFVGSITAAGVGLTLTAASHVIFAELDWVPGNVTQAEDRAHRIGQKDSVLVQHLVVDGSLDAKMAKTIVEKQRIADAVLDNTLDMETGDMDAPVLAGPEDQAATRNLSYDKVGEQAAKLTADEVANIQRATRLLAGYCDGARLKDGSGFNKMDAMLGKRLAELPELTARQAVLARRIIKKYYRQLPADLFSQIYPEGLTSKKNNKSY